MVIFYDSIKFLYYVVSLKLISIRQSTDDDDDKVVMITAINLEEQSLRKKVI